LRRTRPAGARSSGSETLSRNRSLVGYTIDMRESDFSEGTPLENLTPDLGGFLIVLKRQDIIGRFDNIRQIAAGKLQDYCEFPENLPCLRDDVAFADHHAFVVGGRRTERKMKFPTRTPGEKVNDFGQLGFGTSGW